ncbi:MAG: prolipoprotein diacylglyceryl transferase [bacterium]|nr:prolipoprotein diacylglyceryl transferase [bacterium]
MLGWLSTPPGPILFQIGSISVRWYGVILAIALLSGVFLAQRLGKRGGVKQEKIIDLAFIATIAALIGARLVHVLNDWDYYSQHLLEIIKVWHGGLAFHGVLFGGVLALWIFSRWQKITPLLLLDVVFPALALGQVIGRWGNWINQELYGRPTNLPWALAISPEHRVAGYEAFTTFHPLFLYESLGNLAILILLLLLWRLKGRRLGDVAAVYLILSPALRFGLDYLRLGQPMVGPVTNAQIFSLVLIAAGLVLFFTRRQRPVQ